MKKASDILFIDQLPTIDLHGYDRLYADIKVNEFIQDNIILKNEFIVIIHGIGEKILKHEVHRLLSHHKDVLDYCIYFNNVGCTVVKLDIKS